MQSASCPAIPVSELVDTDRGNFAGIYPPVFYAVMGVFVSADISVSVIIMRAVNAVLYVAMMLTAFLLIPPRRRGVLVWGTLTTLVPFGMFLIPSVNPSSWAVISASTLWIAMLGYMEVETTRRRLALGVLASVAVLLGAGSRADASAFAAVSIVLVGILTAKMTRSSVRLGALPAALVVVAVVGFFASGQSNAINPGVNITPPVDPATVPGSWLALLWNNIIRLPELWAGAFGAPVVGRSLWFGTTAPALVWFPPIVVFGGVVFMGLRRLPPRKALAMASIVGLLVILPMIWLMRDEILVGRGVQARYLYPLIIILAGVSLLGFQRADAGLSRIHLLIVTAVAFVGDLVLQWVTLRRFITGLDEFGFNLDLGIEWWWGLPIGPMPLWILGSMAFGTFCTLCLIFGWRANGAETTLSRPEVLPMR